MGFAYKPLEPGEQVTVRLFSLTDQIIMANQSDRLVKIGLEGFAMIDEIYGRRTRRLPAAVAPELQTHQVIISQVTQMKEGTIILNSHEAARKYGGIVYYYHYHGGNGKPLGNWPN